MFRSRAIVAFVLVTTLPVLYALAAGPLVYMRSIGRPLLSDKVFASVYHPLIRAEAKIPPLGRAMHLYVEFWENAAEQHRQA
jgi:hypothetical protein